MSEEAVQLAKKVKKLDTRIEQMRLNDDRVLAEGGIRAERYQPMAPRFEREREKLLERLRTLEEREGKIYYEDPDALPMSDYAADDDGEFEKVDLLSHREAMEEFQSPPTSTDYQLGYATRGRQKANEAAKKEWGLDQEEDSDLEQGDIAQKMMEREQRRKLRKGSKKSTTSRVVITKSWNRPEPSWEGYSQVILVGLFLFVAYAGAFIYAVYGDTTNIPTPW